MKYLLKHGHLVVDGNREYLDGALLINDDVIEDVFVQSNFDTEGIDCKQIDLQGSIVMPGHFDTHTHGINGISFDTASVEELDKASLDMAKSGTTSFLTTLSYDCLDADLDSRYELLNDYDSKYSRFQGIHLEGPFLSKKHLGIGNPDKFLEPDIDMVKSILNKTDKVKQITIAYELNGAKQVGKLLHENNIKVMCGHSDAVYEDLDENVDGFTHLFNAMRGLHHRDKTLVNCAFENKWNVELIADGNHIHEDVLRLVIKNIDRNRIMLVSDSSTARGLPDGEYDFMSKHCIKKGTNFISTDGHFAGSVVSINDEIKVLYSLGAKLTDLLAYSSLNALKFYGLSSRLGTLEKGKYADIVILDDNLDIKNVYLKGTFLY